jgi:hypothetical protein
MRSFLLNNFLPGLEAAGLPESVLYAPRRVVGGDVLNDKLWLPTEREMVGPVGSDGNYINTSYKERPYSQSTETAANQTWFRFFNSDDARYKYCSGLHGLYWYWMSSPYTGSSSAFCLVGGMGNSAGGRGINNTASTVGGCAPAFCVR